MTGQNNIRIISKSENIKFETMFKFFSKKKKDKLMNQGKKEKEMKNDPKIKKEAKKNDDSVFFIKVLTFYFFLKDWTYDYIYQFLISPYWTTPIQSFIDQNCFEVENENHEALKKLFQAKIFSRFFLKN